MRLHPLDSVYQLKANPAWQNFLRHIEFMEGFGLLIVLAVEDAGVEVCRRELQRVLRAGGKKLLTLRIRSKDSAGDLGDSLLRPMPAEVGAIWVGTLAPRDPLRIEAVQLRWHNAVAALNPRRNALRDRLKVPLVFAGPLWLSEVLRSAGPDLWSIRETIAHIEPLARQDHFPFQQTLLADFHLSTAGDERGDPNEIQTALAKLDKRKVSQKDRARFEQLRADLLVRLGRQLKFQYQWADAERALLEAESIFEKFPSDVRSHWTVLQQVGDLYWQIARIEQAQHYCQKAYELAVSSFEPENDLVLQSRVNLAMISANQGHYAEAENELQSVLTVRKQAEGSGQFPALLTWHNMIQTLQKQGRYEDAEHEYEQLLSEETKALGPDHPLTLLSQSDHATLLQTQGKVEEAEYEHRKILNAQQKILGVNHPDTLVSRSQLGAVLLRQGKWIDAEREYRLVLHGRVQTLGLDHLQTLASHFNLALSLAMLGKWDEASGFAKAALHGWEKIWGNDHPQTINAKKLLSMIEAGMELIKLDTEVAKLDLSSAAKSSEPPKPRRAEAV